MSGQLLQFGGSLFAIVLIGWLVHRMGLGQSRALSSDTQARDKARDVEDGFDAVSIARDPDGTAALLRDAQGRVMLLRAHGAHFAGRLLTSLATARIEQDTLVIDTGERRFGSVTLHIENAQAWANVIRAL